MLIKICAFVRLGDFSNLGDAIFNGPLRALVIKICQGRLLGFESLLKLLSSFSGFHVLCRESRWTRCRDRNEL